VREASGDLAGIRVHTVGIDQAVNAGFLGRLASLGGGRCELVESEDRLDAAMDQIHRRIATPFLDVRAITPDGWAPVAGSQAPRRTPHVFPGVPLVLAGRYRGAAGGSVTVVGELAGGAQWRRTVAATVVDNPAVTALWARAHLRDLEDRYAVTGDAALEQEIVATSLRHGVLCRFTAYVAVDSRVVTEGGAPHRVIQPVELPAGWALPMPAGPVAAPMVMAAGAAMAVPPSPPRLARGTGRMLRRAAPAADVSGGPVAEEREAAGYRAASEGADRVPPGAELREQLALEARRLRDAAGEPAARRAELLDDLASRLDALAVHLAAQADPAAGALRDLVTLLRDAGRPVAERWARAVAVLDELSGAPARRAFWKR